MKENMKKKIILMMAVIAMGILFAGCTQASKVSNNVSQQADNFNVIRRLTVLNTRTDKPMFELVSAFSITVDKEDNQLEVICEAGEGVYKKHFIGLNDWTVYVVEDISGASVNKYHYEVNFLPEMISPITFVSED